MRLKQKNVLIILTDISLIILCLISCIFNTQKYNYLFLISVVCYAIMLISWIRVSGTILNYVTVFFSLTYLYYFGQILLKSCGLPISYYINIDNTFSNVEICKTAYFILINILVLHASVIFFEGFLKKKETRTRYVKTTYSKKDAAYTTTSLILLTISFICEVLVLFYKYKINIVSGYASALGSVYNGAGAFSGIVRFLGSLFLPAVFAALVSTKGKKNTNIYVWVCYVLYLAIYFISGSRFDAVISLMGVVLLYHNYYKKIDLKKAIFICGIGIFVLVICSFMNNIRIVDSWGENTSYSAVVKRAVELSLNNNFLMDNLSVTGVQLLVVTTILKYCPSYIPFTYGIYYLGGLLRVIPNLFFGNNNPLITNDIDTIFSTYLTKTHGMGSSFVAEAYYNFGYLSVIMMVIFGGLMIFAMRKIDEVRKGINQNKILIGFIFYITSRSLFWIRSDTRMLLREIVFYYFGIVVLTLIVKQLFYRKD